MHRIPRLPSQPRDFIKDLPQLLARIVVQETIRRLVRWALDQLLSD
jgi:hypothetical protein